MRVDSNTRGHNQWYNFIIKNTSKKQIKINIVNFRKHKTLYNRVILNYIQGLKPYIKTDNNKNGWMQGGKNVKY